MTRKLGCFCLLAALAGCGGRSVAHVTEAGDDDDNSTASENPDQGHPSSSATKSCEDACHQCFQAALDDTCENTCAIVVETAATARCDAALESLFSCREERQTCNSELCSHESNDFSICIINYCDDHPEDLLCRAPI